MADEHVMDRETENDETFADEETPLGVTKEDQAGPRAQREAAISGSWVPGPGSGPEGTGNDLWSYSDGPHPKGEGPDAPNHPMTGHGKAVQRHQQTIQAAGKMTRKPHGAEEEQTHGPKTFGKPEAYALDDRHAPYEDTHEGGLSLAGGSSGSGGGGEQILDSIEEPHLKPPGA